MVPPAPMVAPQPLNYPLDPPLMELLSKPNILTLSQRSMSFSPISARVGMMDLTQRHIPSMLPSLGHTLVCTT